MREYEFFTIMIAVGALAGYVSRWLPLSGWTALLFPIALPPLGLLLTATFC